ncbi:hypothetical protein [Neisseria shayeganii]|uniref:SRPBCC family protein n=1 Tax=Neisseria shayeganii TaxID=607712 RepID=A0A7D7SHY3_9NEIS|nr:hypothetical protein [Neisseria shayeganii]QMT40347.1 hypothetical protein H3L94_11030 [Neisseria shayeganii]
MVRIDIGTDLPCSAEQAAAEVCRPRLLHYVAWPLVVFRPREPAAWPERWVPGTYRAGLYLGGVLPVGGQAIVISYPQQAAFALLDDGHGRLIRRWSHLITIEPDGTGGCRYRDRVEIAAGWLTWPVALFAHVFYRYRQYRWRWLVRQGFDYGRFA